MRRVHWGEWQDVADRDGESISQLQDRNTKLNQWRQLQVMYEYVPNSIPRFGTFLLW